jgi:hypothetical protein
MEMATLVGNFPSVPEVYCRTPVSRFKVETKGEVREAYIKYIQGPTRININATDIP